ncbi:MAG: hydroxyacid dehydrogenase [Chloroflexi bacterium]|jgi:phosphoglycerate dehydrogenase-like enzyme|nr:hydroxyacid dehydrogenase [Chloroflexota bacterium]
MSKPIIAITIGKSNYPRIMNSRNWKALDSFAEVIHHTGPEAATKEDLIALLPEADACITSWDVARLDADVMAAAPKLKAIAHAGGSVKRFISDEVWKRNIQVFSTSAALGRDVAETTLGLMIVGMKHIFPLNQNIRKGGWRDTLFWPARELHGKTVGLIGAGMIGTHVIELLQPFSVNILLYDPFVSQEEAARLKVEKVDDVSELARRADIISLHAPANESTYHILDAERLKMMKSNAVLVNTARGTLIDEPALIEELSQGRFYAFLDVTDPEPPAADSPLRRLENVVVTPHLAGCIEDCTGLGAMAVEELRRFFAGEPALHPVHPDMFARIS